MAIYRTQRLYSKPLPDDWDSDDDAYVEMVEKAKARNKKIAKVGPWIVPAVYTGIGATMGAQVGGIMSGTRGALTGAALGAATGGGTAYATQKVLGGYLRSKGRVGQDKESYKKLSDRDQKAANRALSKYRGMKTKEERLAYRKQIKSRV